MITVYEEHPTPRPKLISEALFDAVWDRMCTLEDELFKARRNYDALRRRWFVRVGLLLDRLWPWTK